MKTRSLVLVAPKAAFDAVLARMPSTDDLIALAVARYGSEAEALRTAESVELSTGYTLELC